VRSIPVFIALLAGMNLASAQGSEPVEQEDELLGLQAASLTAEQMAELRGGINFGFSLPSLVDFRFSANQRGIDFGLRSINRTAFFQLPPNPCKGSGIAAC
jgi:hypothetical protein